MERITQQRHRQPCRPAAGPLRPRDSCLAVGVYERDAVVEFLSSTGQFGSEYCERTELSRSFGHITRLRDVFAVHLTRAPPAGEGIAPEGRPPWVCALDPSAETNGRHGFVALRPCGHVLRDRAWREAGGGGACPVCSAAVGAAVALFPDADTVAKLRAELETARAARAAIALGFSLGSSSAQLGSARLAT